MKPITCFIASAFGYEDVDSIYDNSIKIVLKELNIKPLRVDKINHNDKIDSKIIELINECDFGIVDLTYARPSAYYEAGFIEGLNKTVIYISRHDHFKHKETDIFGNLRIHFDLITKNVIPWKNVNKLFNKQLKTRVSLILKPINKKRSIQHSEIEKRREFELLSIRDRINSVEERFRYLLEKSKFKLFQNEKHRDTFFKYRNKNIYKKNKTILKFECSSYTSIDDFYHASIKNTQYLVGENNLTLVYISLKQIPKSRIESGLHIFTPITDKIFRLNKLTIIVLDSIDSILKLEQKFKLLEL